MTEVMDKPADAPAQNGNGGTMQRRQENLPAIPPPRLPYHPAIEERFGVDRSSWKALVEAIFPNAQSTESVILALSYCRARKLDPFKRNVHIVPIWDSERRCEVDTIWPGIGELRTTAFRTGEYAGREPATFGQDKTQTFKGMVGRRGQEKMVEETVTFPEWAQITVYRMVRGQRVAFAGPKVHWIETYATRGKSDVPNEMWANRPRGQLEKCGEAAALRAAFPEEVGSDYIAEEVGGPGSSGTKQVESTVAPERGTGALLKKLTSKPVSDGQEFEAAPDAVEQVARQQVDTETGEVAPISSQPDAQSHDVQEPEASHDTPDQVDPAREEFDKWLIGAQELAEQKGIDAADFRRRMQLVYVGAKVKNKEWTLTAAQRENVVKAIRERSGHFAETK